LARRSYTRKIERRGRWMNDKTSQDGSLIPAERIERSILLIRRQKVMLDRDLAQLYGVETRALNQAVRRNIERFPEDFMFRLTREEIFRISQFVTSSAHLGIETLKFSKNVRLFTEHGVAMLSSVLNSPRAVQVNIQIMRTFAKLREIISLNKDLARRLDELEKKYDAQFKIVFDAIRQLMASPEPGSAPPKRRIGFLVEEPKVPYITRTKKKSHDWLRGQVSTFNIHHDANICTIPFCQMLRSDPFSFLFLLQACHIGT